MGAELSLWLSVPLLQSCDASLWFFSLCRGDTLKRWNRHEAGILEICQMQLDTSLFALIISGSPMPWFFLVLHAPKQSSQVASHRTTKIGSYLCRRHRPSTHTSCSVQSLCPSHFDMNPCCGSGDVPCPVQTKNLHDIGLNASASSVGECPAPNTKVQCLPARPRSPASSLPFLQCPVRWVLTGPDQQPFSARRLMISHLRPFLSPPGRRISMRNVLIRNYL